jgi:hypothetical protein
MITEPAGMLTSAKTPRPLPPSLGRMEIRVLRVVGKEVGVVGVQVRKSGRSVTSVRVPVVVWNEGGSVVPLDCGRVVVDGEGEGEDCGGV